MSILQRLRDLVDDRNFNQDLYRSGAADRNEVRETTVGWRRDPIHREDDFIADSGNDCAIGIDPVTGHYIYATPSGNEEYYKVVRRGRRQG